MKAMFRLAGIAFGRSELVWHDFRHDAATILTADLHTPLSVTKEITGHSNTQILERYVNPQLEVRRRALRLNGAHLLPLVRAGVTFIDGVRQERSREEDRKEAA